MENHYTNVIKCFVGGFFWASCVSIAALFPIWVVFIIICWIEKGTINFSNEVKESVYVSYILSLCSSVMVGYFFSKGSSLVKAHEKIIYVLLPVIMIIFVSVSYTILILLKFTSFQINPIKPIGLVLAAILYAGSAKGLQFSKDRAREV